MILAIVPAAGAASASTTVTTAESTTQAHSLPGGGWHSPAEFLGNLVLGRETGNTAPIIDDILSPGVGQAMLLSRTYNPRSLDPSGAFGPGWRVSFDRRLKRHSDGSATYVDGRGMRTRIPQPQLEPEASGSVLVQTPDGLVDRFDADGRLLSYETATGHRLAVRRDSQGRVVELSDELSALSARVDYNSSGQIAAVTDQIGRSTRYGYNLLGQLATVTNAAGSVWTYDYYGMSMWNTALGAGPLA